MASRSGQTIPSRFRARTVRGEPYKVDELALTPEARVIAFGRARANIGAERISALGAGFAQITPVAVVVTTPEGDRRVPIVDATAAELWRLGAIAAAILLLGACIRWLARPR